MSQVVQAEATIRPAHVQQLPSSRRRDVSVAIFATAIAVTETDVRRQQVAGWDVSRVGTVGRDDRDAAIHQSRNADISTADAGACCAGAGCSSPASAS